VHKTGTPRVITNFLVGIEQNIVKGLINECKREMNKLVYPFTQFYSDANCMLKKKKEKGTLKRYRRN